MLCSYPGVRSQVRQDGVSLLLVAPIWPTQVWFSDLISLLDDPPWEIPIQKDLLSQAVATIYHFPTQDVETMGLDPDGDQLLGVDLSTDVIETI